jgi:tetratricopeptide (TPR) repeat protein
MFRTSDTPAAVQGDIPDVPTTTPEGQTGNEVIAWLGRCLGKVLGWVLTLAVVFAFRYGQALQRAEQGPHTFYGQALQDAERRQHDYDSIVGKLERQHQAEEQAARAKAHIDRGKIYSRNGDPDRAISEFTKALELGTPTLGSGNVAGFNVSSRALVYFARGSSYFDKRQYERAIADLNEGIRLDPNKPLFYFVRGVCHRMEGRLNEAMADFEAGLRLNPPDPQAYQDHINATRAARDGDGR